MAKKKWQEPGLNERSVSETEVVVDSAYRPPNWAIEAGKTAFFDRNGRAWTLSTASRINFNPGSRALSEGPNIGCELVRDGNPVLGFARDYRSFVVISSHEVCPTPRASRRAVAVA